MRNMLTVIATVVFVVAVVLTAPGQAWHTPQNPTTTTVVGDDNGDGRIDEDESGFDCRIHGNGLCGSEVRA